MSEYWVSHQKFYCKYCKVYIADDKPSRSHHDSGMRHKGNLERYIRDIYKKGNKQEREKAEEARQIASIDAAAAAAMGISVAQASTSGSLGSHTRKKAASSSTSGGSYSTAESLGYVDPDAERLQREKELREKEGYAGDWEIVAPTPGPSRPRSTSAEQQGGDTNDSIPSQDALSKTSRGELDNRKISHSYLKEKALPVLDDDDYDQIKIKVRKPKEVPAATDALAKAREQAKTQAPASEAARKQHIADGKKKFKAVELEDYEETAEEQEERYKAALELIEPKGEDDGSDGNAQQSGSGGSAPMFKKRKAKSSDATSANKRRG